MIEMISKFYGFLMKIFLIFKYVFVNIKKFIIKLRIKRVKRYWFVSRNFNFYNPILEATVYDHWSIWKIARYGRHFGAFNRKEDAMDEAFQIWLRDNKYTEIANELEHELKSIQHKILNKHKYQILNKQSQKNANEVYKYNLIKALNPKRVVIFGRPGSGKSTFATWLSHFLGLPLHHFDKHFYIRNWVERDYNEFFQIQQDIVNSGRWIIDGNSTRSLQTRFSKADLVLYFNIPKVVCLFRLLKRFLRPNTSFDDRAPGCAEKIRLPLLKYMWNFEERVAEDIKNFKDRYPKTVFLEIRKEKDLNTLKNESISKP